ncbi:hypothetical protein [Neisseria sicca]
MNKILAKLIEKSCKNNALFCGKSLTELTKDDMHILSGFHTSDVDMIVLNDDYFCGIRANHFVIEFGQSEYYEGDLVLITANHKGTRALTLIDISNEA